MNFPAELKYTKNHEWIKMDGDIAIVGITDFAQDAMGDVIFVDMPEVGDEVAVGERFGDIESVLDVFDLLSPVSGTVCAVNPVLFDISENLNRDPYAFWIIKVEGITGWGDLMDAVAYEAFCAEEG